MSTFKGVIKEFSSIRIDYFRRVSNEAPPLACFLSHVHSDHLQGLESLKAPFLYCSPATREILLRLEKYPHRMNFAKGILESRVQSYRHLKSLLKTIPLETPTTIELRPGYEIRVTLFDANHCSGAVMFLIEGQGKAILYTGDIRSEVWWVNQLVRNPILVPYIGCVKTLDCIYLDTTFASKTDRYRDFPSKAEGLKELIEKAAQYPEDTVFYLEAWTFGYEEVWLALSAFLQSQVHLDRYRWSLYRSLATIATSAIGCSEANRLCGFQLGNHRKEGCLTADPQTRLHSCEKGTGCPSIQGNAKVVRIIPIVSRLPDGAEIHELGIGGGKGDLDQIHELEVNDASTLGALMQLCANTVQDKELLLRIFSLLNSSSTINLGSDIESKMDNDEIKLEELVQILGDVSGEGRHSMPIYKPQSLAKDLPREISFPYSRHSSYSELCDLLKALKPRDVYPCTVDEASWTPAVGVRALFGHLCSGDTFVHDLEMTDIYERRHGSKRSHDDGSQATEATQHTVSTEQRTSPLDQKVGQGCPPKEKSSASTSGDDRFYTPANIQQPSTSATKIAPKRQDLPIELPQPTEQPVPSLAAPGTSDTSPSRSRSRKIRKWAYMAAVGMDDDCDTWDAFGGLKCVQKPSDETEL